MLSAKIGKRRKAKIGDVAIMLKLQNKNGTIYFQSLSVFTHFAPYTMSLKHIRTQIQTK